MLRLTRNTAYPDSQSENAKPTLGLLTPNKVEPVAPEIDVFSFSLPFSLAFILEKLPAFCPVLQSSERRLPASWSVILLASPSLIMKQGIRGRGRRGAHPRPAPSGCTEPRALNSALREMVLAVDHNRLHCSSQWRHTYIPECHPHWLRHGDTLTWDMNLNCVNSEQRNIKHVKKNPCCMHTIWNSTELTWHYM